MSDVSDVSVVMATYNGARHIREQLQSILSQTRPPAEIVIGDDGSSDDTIAILEEISAISPIPLRITQNTTRLGFADNFLEAAKRTSQPYIAFSDQDDRWHPQKLERARAAIDRFDAAMATHQVVLTDGDGRPLKLDTQMITTTRALEAGTTDPFGLYFGFAMMVDRRILDLLPHEEKGIDSYRGHGTLPHDRWIHFLASTFGRTAVIAEPLAYYRQHATQTYGVRPPSLTQRVRNKIAEGPAKLEVLAQIARARAELIERSEPHEADLAERAMWGRAKSRWRHVQHQCEARCALYQAPTLLARSRRVLRAARAGTYRSVEHGGLGNRRIVEDLTLGLFGKAVFHW